MATYNSYVICTSPRSGSTLLCNMLAATGVAGKPASYFFGTSLDGWLDDLAIEPKNTASERDIVESAFHTALAMGRDGTDLFGLRMQGHSFGFFLEKLAVLYPNGATDSERFQLAFGTTLFVHLTRPDKIGQAVSYLKAQQTGLWHLASDGSELERSSAHRDPIYDGEKLRTCVETMIAYERTWNNWFESEGIEPVRLSYDELSLDPLGILRHVLNSLGLDPIVANGVTPGVRKLADHTNSDWAARYRAEHTIFETNCQQQPCPFREGGTTQTLP